MKYRVSPTGGHEGNYVAALMRIVSILIWVCGVIAAIIVFVNGFVAIGFGVIAGAFASGMLFYGIAEIISILTRIKTLHYDVEVIETIPADGNAPRESSDKNNNTIIQNEKKIPVFVWRNSDKELVCPRCNCHNDEGASVCRECGQYYMNNRLQEYWCGECGKEGPYDGSCPECGSSHKIYNRKIIYSN